jgi:hypothetical protein
MSASLEWLNVGSVGNGQAYIVLCARKPPTGLYLSRHFCTLARHGGSKVDLPLCGATLLLTWCFKYSFAVELRR